MSRICIAGWPRAGKTTLARDIHERTRIDPDHDAVGVLRHTDSTIDLGWSEASAEVATWFDAPGPWIIEGVAVPRALRKWMAAHPEGKPCDVVYWLAKPFLELTKWQQTMAKGCVSVWESIQRALVARGAEIRLGMP